MKSSKILNLLIAGIAIIGGILFVRIFTVETEAIETDVAVQNSIISPLISFSYYLFLATVIVTIVLSLISLFRHPDALKKTLLGLAVLGVILVIAYFIADSDAVYDAAGKIQPGGEAGSATNRWVGAGIWYSVILGGLAGLFFIVDMLKGLIKS